MSRKRAIDSQMVDSMAQNMLTLLPLARKRLLRLDIIQKEHQMPFSHLQVLALLHLHDSLSVSEISRRLGIAKPNITPLVDRLYEAGYVNRQHDAQDRRVVNISLEAAGREKLEKIRADLSVHIHEQLSTLNAADCRELSNSISSMVRILDLI